MVVSEANSSVQSEDSKESAEQNCSALPTPSSQTSSVQDEDEQDHQTATFGQTQLKLSPNPEGSNSLPSGF